MTHNGCKSRQFWRNNDIELAENFVLQFLFAILPSEIEEILS